MPLKKKSYLANKWKNESKKFLVSNRIGWILVGPQSKWGTLWPREMSVLVWLPYTLIYISQPKPKEILNFLCLVTSRALFLWSFPPLFGDHCLGEQAGESEVPARGGTRGTLNSRLEDEIGTTTCPQFRKCAGKCHRSKNHFLLV